MAKAPITKRGRPTKTPKRVTVTLSQHHAEELQKLAAEADVTVSALCAHVLERYAIQDRELMTNDVIAQRLEAIMERHAQDFAARFGDVLLRVAHEVVATRRQDLAQLAQSSGPEFAKSVGESGWQAAVKSLRPYTQKIKGDQQTENSTSEAQQ